MRVWAVANQKGGVGKTTTTVTLGGLLSGPEQRVLLVDVDPHGSLTAYFGFDPRRPPAESMNCSVSVPTARVPIRRD